MSKTKTTLDKNVPNFLLTGAFSSNYVAFSEFRPFERTLSIGVILGFEWGEHND